MAMNRRDDLIDVLAAVRSGREGARDELVRTVYNVLRGIAGRLMRGERPDHTLQPSALVNEAVLRLLRGKSLAKIPNRRYLFGAATEAMRRVLVEHARGRAAQKRDPGRARVPLDKALTYCEEQHVDVIALDKVLKCLAQVYPRAAEVVELRFFGDLTVSEVAEMLGVSDTTVESDWRFARAWLRDNLADTPQ
jgi:RNA polymerase sigma factor (TIGR02999 family)